MIPTFLSDNDGLGSIGKAALPSADTGSPAELVPVAVAVLSSLPASTSS